MQVTSLETAEGLLRRLSVQVPAEQVEQAVEQRLKELARRVRMDGFRPGKAPLAVVRQRYGVQAREEAIGELIERSYVHALSEQNLRPAGGPNITDVDMVAGEGLRYVAEIEVMPEVALADLSGLSIERPVAEITEADVEEVIENLRRQRMSFQPVDRPAAGGDQVTVDFQGRMDGEPFEGGNASDMRIELGRGMLLQDLETPLLGMRAGEHKTVEVTFPEDYRVESLAGKKASFEVTLKEVREPVLPEIDEAFCAAFGVEGVAALREEVRKNMERELAKAIKRRLKQQVMDGLLQLHELQVPKALVEQEARRLREQLAEQMRGGSNPDTLPLNIFEPEAERRVKLGLLVAELIRSEGLRPEPARAQAILEDIAAGYEDPNEVKTFYMSRPELRESLEAMASEEQVVEHVLSKAQVTDKAMRFADVVQSES